MLNLSLPVPCVKCGKSVDRADLKESRFCPVCHEQESKRRLAARFRLGQRVGDSLVGGQAKAAAWCCWGVEIIPVQRSSNKTIAGAALFGIAGAVVGAALDASEASTNSTFTHKAHVGLIAVGANELVVADFGKLRCEGPGLKVINIDKLQDPIEEGRLQQMCEHVMRLPLDKLSVSALEKSLIVRASGQTWHFQIDPMPEVEQPQALEVVAAIRGVDQIPSHQELMTAMTGSQGPYNPRVMESIAGDSVYMASLFALLGKARREQVEGFLRHTGNCPPKFVASVHDWLSRRAKPKYGAWAFAGLGVIGLLAVINVVGGTLSDHVGISVLGLLIAGVIGFLFVKFSRANETSKWCAERLPLLEHAQEGGFELVEQ